MTAFDVRLDLITGLATNSDAGSALITRLTGIPALNVRDAADRPRLTDLLREKLALTPARTT